MSEHPPQTNGETPNPADSFEDIRDLVEVGDDDNGDGVNTLHRPDGSGKLLSVDELEMIREHQDLIRGEGQELSDDDRETEIRAEKIAHYIHKHSKGKGTSPDVVKELYKRLEEEGDGFLDDPENPDSPDEPQDPDAPTEVMPTPESRFNPEELQKQREIMAQIDDADKIFDRHKRMRRLTELAEQYKEVDFAGDTGTLGVEAAQRIRVSKTRSKLNPRRFWVKNTKKSNYTLSQMAYKENEKYSLHAAKAMGGNLYIANKTVYAGRNETIHRTNKWYETKVVVGLEDKMDDLIRQETELREQIAQTEQELLADNENTTLVKELESLRELLLKKEDLLNRTYTDYERRRYDTLDALGTLRGFGGNEYFGKGIAYLAITKDQPELLYALEGLNRVKLGFRDKPIEVPLLGKARELYHKVRIKKAADAMIIPQILKDSLDELQDQRNRGDIDNEQFEQYSLQLVSEARNVARNIKQPDWRDLVIVQIDKQSPIK
ncbi:hypothetical protein A3F64_01490 [Candidatus Saccharibacteria bacterium RIFCSPHIGHO2_12_FULL_42_8]|nr:MAG: hypothetical protein A3F64_01490 [Candidatus Saccharibacteria bacterium RIFCSPHIGHO2_12_FULL_42_8]